MKTILSLFFGIFSTFSLNAQTKKIDRLATELNTLMTSYHQITHFGDEYLPVKAHPFTLDELSGSSKLEPEFFTTDYDSVDRFTLLGTYFEAIDTLILQLVKTKGFTKYPLEKLNIEVTTSPDRRLYCFQYAANNGGSYMEVNSIMAFETENGMQTSFEYGFRPDGYYAIDTIQHRDSLIYVLSSSVKGCNTCYFQEISAIVWSGTYFDPVFGIEIESRDWDTELRFDNDANTITLEYFEDDLNGGCRCETEYYDYDDDREMGHDVKCKEIYHFENGRFVLIENSMKRMPE